MCNINYFSLDPSKTDPLTLQAKFAARLKRHNVMSYEEVAAVLFHRLRHNQETAENILFCPFPFISSTKMIHNHAKKIKKAINEEPGLSLGRCQMILAETYGYKTWQAFKIAVFKHYGEEESLLIIKEKNRINKFLRKEGTSI